MYGLANIMGQVLGHVCVCRDCPEVVVVVVLGFYVPPTAKVIWRRDLGLKSHPKDSVLKKNEENLYVLDIDL